ncbi:hypothetical protein FRC02_002809 [Tulasnella sp. 418]|nr:hypothetical protein FRC02_002809 [Tulasnella sp. 418]
MTSSFSKKVACIFVRLCHSGYAVTHANVSEVNVPGLAEKRPSVLRGDHIEIRLKQKQDVVYEGLVETIQDLRVGLLFHQDFRRDWQPGALCEVRFMINRIPLRRMHQALDLPFLPRRLLFPDQADFDGISRPTQHQIDQIQPKNSQLKSNPPQMEAVTAIVNQPQGAPPFVIFGPPGTGKTVTVVEAILQILEKDPAARILACAPSNPAADLIALRLIGKTVGQNPITPKELFRLNATYRFPISLPSLLEPYTYKDQLGRFSVTSRAALESFRVVVSTCGSACVPYGVGMEAGHFTHIIIDEAGQALEPECMIPIKTMGSQKTNFILAGDPKQLGPIIRSAVARPFGFAVSYLERMMNMPVYNETDGHGISVVKLTKNWRNHEAILHFPNEQFYGGDLEVCAPTGVKDALLGSPVLNNPKFPVVFHGVPGQDEQEAGSPSYFNILEISQVTEYVDQLLADQSHPIVPEDICVIAPYNAQVKKVRQRLKENYENIKVGSVEMCQGEVKCS